MEHTELKRLVDYSAGAMIMSLVPGEERVALVLNKESKEVQWIPKDFLGKRRYKDALVEEREDGAIVWFTQPKGFGPPFGKEEPEDGKDRVVTAAREAEEETGKDIRSILIPSVSYTERPNDWSVYSNTVFLANGVDFSFNKDAMKDPLVDPRFSAMWKLRRLPILRRRRHTGFSSEPVKRKPHQKERHNAGIYQAAFRRIIAVLLQLDSHLCEQLGRPGVDNAEDLVSIVQAQMPYASFFSHRTLKMFSGLNRLDLVVGRLEKDEGILHEEKAARIGANLILWLPYRPDEQDSLLNRALKALYERCDPRGRRDVAEFFLDRLERREKVYLVSLDKSAGLLESDEKQVVEDDSDGDEAPEADPSNYAEFMEKVEEDY